MPLHFVTTFWATILWLVVTMAMGGYARAAETTGIIKTLQGTVSVERAGTTIPAQLGASVLEADQIVTGGDGSVGVTFQDNSLLSLGPNSRLAIAHFNFDSTTHDGNFETVLTRGKLAVISGKIAKHKQDAMKVRTPSSILGVRGTEFLVEVAAP